MEQQQQQHRILGHAVGREITLEEMSEVAGGEGGLVGTRPFQLGHQTVYLDMVPDPNM